MGFWPPHSTYQTSNAVWICSHEALQLSPELWTAKVLTPFTNRVVQVHLDEQRKLPRRNSRTWLLFPDRRTSRPETTVPAATVPAATSSSFFTLWFDDKLANIVKEGMLARSAAAFRNIRGRTRARTRAHTHTQSAESNSRSANQAERLVSELVISTSGAGGFPALAMTPFLRIQARAYCKEDTARMKPQKTRDDV